MVKRRKRSWIVDGLFALACVADGLELLLVLVDERAFVEYGNVSFGSCVRG